MRGKWSNSLHSSLQESILVCQGNGLLILRAHSTLISLRWSTSSTVNFCNIQWHGALPLAVRWWQKLLTFHSDCSSLSRATSRRCNSSALMAPSSHRWKVYFFKRLKHMRSCCSFMLARRGRLLDTVLRNASRIRSLQSLCLVEFISILWLIGVDVVLNWQSFLPVNWRLVVHHRIITSLQ